METITIKRVMDRLMDNPIMVDLKESSAGAYLKDMLSINKITGSLVPKTVVLQPEDGIAELPKDFVVLKGIYYCPEEYETDPSLFKPNRLVASTENRHPNISKKVMGSYRIEYGSVFLATDDKIILEYLAIPVDEYGYPTLPYDGSLMEAATNWVKFKYLSILAECGKVAMGLADRAHREYTWYIGQYTMNKELPTYDEAVAWANTWQRLIDTRNEDPSAKGFREHLKM